MEIHSEAFEAGGRIPDDYTCEGADRSPPLAWSGVPAGARSLVLIVDDPDAPGGTWAHWGVYDIPAHLAGLEEDFARHPAPGVRQARNDFGRIGYGGPCPPPGHGVHHYRFRLLALDTGQLELPPRPHSRDVEAAARPHVLESAELVGTYSR